ncbi:hypothetical protein KIW84_033740 [Lathyrus oleraceus]|uniref:F-box domain-containing protein n=1 Tax=Pisum sativum TaxID=3888 RepID=A0A9D4XWP3_PEA|nr:hypothetical protein KIW84_033740 [Pisum sativum]
MKNNKSNNSYSNDHLFYEILVRIFTVLHVADLAKASMVCKAWNVASRAPELWKTLDLNELGMDLPLRPYAWFGEHSSKKMTQILKYASSLGGENISCLIFNYYVYLTNAHLISIAERTPNLKMLVLPITGNISKFGVETAMRSWRNIESITITEMFKNVNFFEVVGKYCKNIVRLKFTCSFEKGQAEGIVKYIPNLRTLIIRNVMVLGGEELAQTPNFPRKCVDGILQVESESC